MTLKELRKRNGLTQREAAHIVGISYRTYLRYEDNSNYISKYKYKKIYEDLEKATLIDEEHGLLSINDIKEIVTPILTSKDIHYCYLFGSYARNEAKPTSDVDLLIDTEITGVEFLMLIDELRDALKKKVDLLRLCDLSMDNPIVLTILREGIRLV